jgi:prepilin-type processing-associated H-X9-DG protein
VLFMVVYGIYGKGRIQAEMAGCQKNLRELGAALHMYIADNDGYYPPNRATPEYQNESNNFAGVHWQEYLRVYVLPNNNAKLNDLKNWAAIPFWCPGDHKRWNSISWQSYAVNRYRGGGDDIPVNRRYAAEPDPAARLYLIDGARESNSTVNLSTNTWPFNKGGSMMTPNTDTRVEFRHDSDSKAQALFLDGHVESMSVEQLWGATNKLIAPK